MQQYPQQQYSPTSSSGYGQLGQQQQSSNTLLYAVLVFMAIFAYLVCSGLSLYLYDQSQNQEKNENNQI
jgi:membrane protein insertase Oxa1/YidC/SpoIIIJ